MVKSVLGVNHRGLRDWVVQRVSAVMMTIYALTLIGYLLTHSDISYGEWRMLFSLTWVKIATLLFLLAMLLHAWIGMWTIFTDYVKPFVLRFILHVLVLLTLTACFMWGVMILWSV